MSRLLIEGLTPEELLALPNGELEQLVLTADPVVFAAGTSTILGHFMRDASRLTVELAHIDGGGEGVLLVLAVLARRLAKRWELGEIDWLVHATRCADPNPRLRRVLEARGFVVQELAGKGAVFRKVESVGDS